MDYLKEADLQCQSETLDENQVKSQFQNIKIPQISIKECDKLSIDTNSSANSTMYSNKGSKSDNSRSERNFMFLIKTFETKYPQDVKRSWSKSSTPRSKNSNENRRCKLEFNEIEELRDEDFFDVQKKQTIPKLKMIRDDLEFKSSCCTNNQTNSMKFEKKNQFLLQSSMMNEEHHYQYKRNRCRSLEPLEEDFQNEDELKTKHKFPTMVDKNEFNQKLKNFIEKQYQNNSNDRRYSVLVFNDPQITSIQEENENEIKDNLNDSFEKSANDSCSSFPIYMWKKIDEVDDLQINSKKKKLIIMDLDNDQNVVIQEDPKGEEKVEEDPQLNIFKTVKEKMQDEKKFLKKLIKGEQLTEDDIIRLNLEKDYSKMKTSDIIAEEEDNFASGSNQNSSNDDEQQQSIQ